MWWFVNDGQCTRYRRRWYHVLIKTINVQTFADCRGKSYRVFTNVFRSNRVSPDRKWHSQTTTVFSPDSRLSPHNRVTDIKASHLRPSDMVRKPLTVRYRFTRKRWRNQFLVLFSRENLPGYENESAYTTNETEQVTFVKRRKRITGEIPDSWIRFEGLGRCTYIARCDFLSLPNVGKVFVDVTEWLTASRRVWMRFKPLHRYSDGRPLECL